MRLSCIISSKNFKFHKSHRYYQSSSSSFNSNIPALHANAIKKGSFQLLDVSNYLLDLYVKNYHNLLHAHNLFDEILDRNVRSWTILISGFAKARNFNMVFGLFRRMGEEGLSPNQFTLSTVLKLCSSLCDIRNGKGIHGWVLSNGIELDAVLENSILDLYVKCGDLDCAERCFEAMKVKETASWNILVGGYLRKGEVERAVRLFRGLDCKDVVSWNTIIDGLMRNGFEKVALELLYEMVETGPCFSEVSFTIALNLVSCLSLSKLGKEIHACVVRLGFHGNGFLRNSVLDMYCKCGKVEEATRVFRKMPVEISCGDPLAEVVSWSSMVSGYVRNGKYECALQLFCFMLEEQVSIDKFTLTTIVSACANTGVVELGRQIHALIEKLGHKIDCHLSSSLIDMYAKCGNLIDARMIFKQNIDPNVVIWTSMISGYALHGQGREAVCLFDSMINERIKPNEITFIGVLTACNHSGMLEEGRKYFNLMQNVHRIKPLIEHYACMVDLYGRAGQLHEAKRFILKNNISHLSVIWKSFLSSCGIHKNTEMGKWASEKLLQIEKSDASSYILLSNMYAKDHQWEEVANVRSLMQQREVSKLPGQSWIEMKDRVYSFGMGDRSHPEEADIYSNLEKLIGRLKEVGYLVDRNNVMQDVEEEQSEVLVSFHSEKRALVYGIMCSPSDRKPIRIMKNLRICIDCHNFMKYSSQLLDREIIVRDIRRFHHFKHGSCSCGDYW